MKLSKSVIPGSKGKPTFAKLSRQDTGTSFMDSGGLTGRHWQRALPSNDPYFEINKWIYTKDKSKHEELLAYIPLHTFLDAHLNIDVDLTHALRRLESKEGNRFNYSDAAEAMSEYLDVKVQCSDYTYNYENDLTQDFQYSVLSNKSDWFYDDKAIILIETHNGADARGGFSDIVVCRPKDDLSHLLEPKAGISILSGTKPDGTKMTHEECQELDEQWSIGYSNNPVYTFSQEVAKIITKKGKTDTANVVMKSGHKLKVFITTNIGY